MLTAALSLGKVARGGGDTERRTREGHGDSTISASFCSFLFFSNILFFSDINLRSHTAKQPAAPVLSRDAAARHKGLNFHHPPAREKNLGTGNLDRPISFPPRDPFPAGNPNHSNPVQLTPVSVPLCIDQKIKKMALKPGAEPLVQADTGACYKAAHLSKPPPKKKPQNAPFSHSGCLREDGSGVEALAACEGAGRPAAIYGRCQHPLTALAARCCTHGRERP